MPPKPSLTTSLRTELRRLRFLDDTRTKLAFIDDTDGVYRIRTFVERGDYQFASDAIDAVDLLTKLERTPPPDAPPGSEPSTADADKPSKSRGGRKPKKGLPPPSAPVSDAAVGSLIPRTDAAPAAAGGYPDTNILNQGDDDANDNEETLP